MESLYFLVPVALIFIAIAVKILWWAINNGQYDNLDTEAHRILFEEQTISTSETKSSPQITTPSLTPYVDDSPNSSSGHDQHE